MQREGKRRKNSKGKGERGSRGEESERNWRRVEGKAGEFCPSQILKVSPVPTPCYGPMPLMGIFLSRFSLR